MLVEVIRPFMKWDGEMAKKGDKLNVNDFLFDKYTHLGVVRRYAESEKIVRKPEHGFEPTWSELRTQAMEKGIFKVGMKKEEIKKALNDLRE